MLRDLSGQCLIYRRRRNTGGIHATLPYFHQHGPILHRIPAFIIPWIQQQKMFWSTGHVNLSPKGFDNTFHIVDEKQVWYEDMTGSGAETIAHLRENGRITILFCAFDGPPRIVRLFGTGTVHEFDTPGYNAFIPLDKRQPGSRSVIVIDIHKVGTANRMRLHGFFARKESEDIKAESCTTMESEPPRSDKGLKAYWESKNIKSIDGLPALLTAFNSTTTFDQSIVSQTGARMTSAFHQRKSNGAQSQRWLT
ncbi:hypothetical protein BJ912DRAFT_974135 [Pholiota molesta]|nr:hypothetical protein BJ912DRAFT_974135 [Pholiota molesta]